jgi:protein SCO1/2
MMGVLLIATGAAAQAPRPKVLDAVGIEQRIGAPLPLDAPFTDEQGRPVRLGDYVGDTPVLLVPAYYGCPMLCGLVLDGVVTALRALAFDVGREFSVVVFSFSPTESAAQAAEKKRAIAERYRRAGSDDGWHFLTGSADSIRRLTTAIGFRYGIDEATGEYAHAAGVMLLTPAGRISHYFYGVEYAPRELRLALVEASDNRLGSPVDRLMLYCFRYDPTTGRYSRISLQALRAAGMVTVLGLAALVVVLLRRERPGARRALGSAGMNG